MPYAFKRLRKSVAVHNAYGLVFRRLDPFVKLPVPEVSAENGVLHIVDPSGQATEFRLILTPVCPRGRYSTDTFTEIAIKGRASCDLKVGIHRVPIGFNVEALVRAQAYDEHNNAMAEDSDLADELIIEMPQELRDTSWEFNVDTFPTLYSYEDKDAQEFADYTYNFLTRVWMQFECAGETYNAIDFTYAVTKNSALYEDPYEIVIHKMYYVKEATKESAKVRVYQDDNKLVTDDGFLDDKYKSIKILHPPYAIDGAEGHFEEFGTFDTFEFIHEMVIDRTVSDTCYYSEPDAINSFVDFLKENADKV